MKRWLRWAWAGPVAAVALGAGACRSQSSAPALGDSPTIMGNGGSCIDEDGDGFGRHCTRGFDCDDQNASITNECYACAIAATGCPCSVQGERASCGAMTSRSSTQTTCSSGQRVCSNGTWGDCLPDGKSTRSFSTAAATRRLQGLADPTPCVENICDPYCHQFADTPDDTLTTATIAGTDAGLTLPVLDGGIIASPNGPLPPDIAATIADAGLAPRSGSAPVLYHELGPAMRTSDTIAGAVPSGADIYVLDYTVGRETSHLHDFMDSLSGTIADRIRSEVVDATFGAGRYEQYNQWPWNGTGTATVPYEHLLSLTTDRAAFSSAVDWLDRHLYDTFPAPRSWTAAVFGLSTTDGLRASGGFVVPPRAAWSSPLGGDSGPCPSGTRGYPCFRRGATPITILLADAPSSNGPGGHYAYERSAAVGVDAARRWSQAAPPVPIAGNGSETTAPTLDVATFSTYAGNTEVSGTASQTWEWEDFDDCRQGFYRAKNVFYRFEAETRTWFHFDTIGSSFNTVLYLYRDSGSGIACNVRAFFDTQSATSVSSIEGVVDPGDYFLVVDGLSGATGDYVLHVNAMPDGAAVGPVAAPNYDEAVAAYNAIGGKIVSVDWSGSACHDGPNSFVEQNTPNALEKLALDTRSVDSEGKPYTVHLDPWGPPCLSRDPPVESQIGDAVRDLAKRPVDISVVAVDVDDATDFDGPPSGPTRLTSMNIDDASFLLSVSAVPTAQALASCQSITAERFRGCVPGTPVSFAIELATPPNVRQQARAQIFTFALRIMGDDTSVISETPVVIVVPGAGSYQDAWFVRDYDVSGVCPPGTAPTWGNWSWSATTPGDSRVDFDVAVARSTSDLGTTPFDPLQFTDALGPAALVGQFIGALDGNPDTQQGGALIDDTLLKNERPRDLPALRMRAHLIPSSNRLRAPTLETWNLEVSCRPAE